MKAYIFNDTLKSKHQKKYVRESGIDCNINKLNCSRGLTTYNLRTTMEGIVNVGPHNT